MVSSRSHSPRCSSAFAVPLTSPEITSLQACLRRKCPKSALYSVTSPVSGYATAFLILEREEVEDDGEGGAQLGSNDKRSRRGGVAARGETGRRIA